MEVVGVIKVIGSSNQVSEKFVKRDVVITTDEQYPQDILIQFVQDKCDALNNFKVGKSVKIGINLRGREWVNTKGETVYFNTIQGWQISEVKSDEVHEAKPFEPVEDLVEQPADDLPF